MTKELIGRKEEIRLLDEAYKTKWLGLVAVYGRPGVGKTFLIHTYSEKHLAFKHGKLKPKKVRSRVYFLWNDIQELLQAKG